MSNQESQEQIQSTGTHDEPTTEKSVIVDSWNTEDELHYLLDLNRRQQMVTGIVRTIFSHGTRKVIDPDSDSKAPREVRAEVAVIALENGVTGYCPVQNFSIREFKSHRHFVGRKVDFFIDRILIDTKQLILNGKTAQEMKIQSLWERIRKYQEADVLHEQTFKGVITGVHAFGRGVYVNVEGQDTFMQRQEWSYNNYEVMQAEEGEEISVKIIRVDEENKRLFVSRKATLPNPFAFLEALKYGDAVAGRVSRVDPKDGISVMLENGITVKASKLKELEAPVVDEMVNCTVLKPIKMKENGRAEGRVLITGYPQGKRKMRDLGSFLFK